MKVFWAIILIAALVAAMVTIVIEPTNITKWLLFFALSDIAYIKLDILKLKAFVGMKG